MKSTLAWNRLPTSAFFAAALIALSSCGSQSFDVVQSQENSGPAGTKSVAPKVDILLAVDNTLSTATLQGAIQTSIRNLLGELNGQGWDFRVAVIPLASSNPSITAITASKHAANYGAQSIQAYPGAQQESVPAHLFVPFEQFTTYVADSDLDGGSEPGLKAIATVLNQASTKQNFVRKDAVLATIVFSNGEDTSGATGVNCYVGNTNPACTTTPVSTLTQQIRASKGAGLESSIRLYSVVNTVGYGACPIANGNSHVGTRYMTAASNLGGQSYNACGGQPSAALKAALAGIKQNLSEIKLSFTKRFVRLEKQPNETTIQVAIKRDGQTIAVPKSDGASAGWVYLGYRENVPMIVEPFVGDFRDGYMIQLIGERFKLTGSDTATVDYLPYGVNPSP